MCARYALSLPLSVVAELFGALIDPEHQDALQSFASARYRVLPGQRIPIVRLVNGRRLLQSARWGWPGVARSAGRAQTPQINVRLEGLQRRASEGHSESLVRCLVPATGWYEFTGAEGARTAWFFSANPDSPAPIAFAGLVRPAKVQHDRTAGATATTPHASADPAVAILTQPAAPEIQHLHERMPAPLQLPGGVWLEGGTMVSADTASESAVGARWFARPVNLQGGHTQDDDARMLQPPAQTRLFL